MKKVSAIFCVSLCLLLFDTGCNVSSAQTMSNGAMQSASVNAGNSEKEIDKYAEYQKYAKPFLYELGFKSWRTAEELDPDALVTFYTTLHIIGEIEIPKELPIDEETEWPLIDATLLENTVQMHFDVKAEHIRKSSYYNAKKNAYLLVGIGSVGDMKISNVEQIDELTIMTLKMNIDSTEYKETWEEKVTMKLTDNSFIYLSMESSRS